MAGKDLVTRLSLSPAQRDQAFTDYEAELSFPVSFGRIGYTMKGTLEISDDTTLASIKDLVLKASYEDLKNVPAVYRLVGR